MLRSSKLTANLPERTAYYRDARGCEDTLIGATNNLGMFAVNPLPESFLPNYN